MTSTGYWWLALVLGLVVAVVTVVLLHIFLRQIRRIESAAGLIWQAGKQVAGNTSATWLLGQTSAGLDLLIEEAGRHEALLQSAPVTSGGPQ